MKDYIDLIELSEDSNQSKVAISAALQGRVMTSSSFMGGLTKHCLKLKIL